MTQRQVDESRRGNQGLVKVPCVRLRQCFGLATTEFTKLRRQGSRLNRPTLKNIYIFAGFKVHPNLAKNLCLAPNETRKGSLHNGVRHQINLNRRS